MDIKKPMSVLLIEDNEAEIKKFCEYIENRQNIYFSKITKSSYEGLDYLKTYMLEGIIVDLELHNGEGSGLHFLEEMHKIELEFKPLIIITTNVNSDIVYNHIRELGADFIFYKKQKDYNIDIVINTMLSLRRTLYSCNMDVAKQLTTTETTLEKEDRINKKINDELNLIGISNHLKGRKYLFDAIYYLVKNENGKENETVFYHLANIYKIGNSSISRAMQTAINYAWRLSPIEELILHYKARVNYSTGVPTPTEFIYYYSEKVRKIL